MDEERMKESSSLSDFESEKEKAKAYMKAKNGGKGTIFGSLRICSLFSQRDEEKKDKEEERNHQEQCNFLRLCHYKVTPSKVPGKDLTSHQCHLYKRCYRVGTGEKKVGEIWA